MTVLVNENTGYFDINIERGDLLYSLGWKIEKFIYTNIKL